MKYLIADVEALLIDQRGLAYSTSDGVVVCISVFPLGSLSLSATSYLKHSYKYKQRLWVFSLLYGEIVNYLGSHARVLSPSKLLRTMWVST